MRNSSLAPVAWNSRILKDGIGISLKNVLRLCRYYKQKIYIDIYIYRECE